MDEFAPRYRAAAGLARLAVRWYEARSLSTLLPLLAESAGDWFGCPHAAVAAVDRRLAVQAVDGTAKELVLAEAGLPGTPWRQSAESGQQVASAEAPAGLAEQYVALGVTDVLHLPLTVARTGVIGIVSLYHAGTRRDGPEAPDAFATHAALAVDTVRYRGTVQDALSSQVVISRGMGVLMERYAVDADSAFEVLRRFSQEHNVKLRTIAQQLIDHRSLPDS